MCSIGDNENENDKLEMICYNIDDLSISWKFATPEIFSGLKSKFKFIYCIKIMKTRKKKIDIQI